MGSSSSVCTWTIVAKGYMARPLRAHVRRAVCISRTLSSGIPRSTGGGISGGSPLATLRDTLSAFLFDIPDLLSVPLEMADGASCVRLLTLPNAWAMARPSFERLDITSTNTPLPRIAPMKRKISNVF